jgi:hypothetical protein
MELANILLAVGVAAAGAIWPMARHVLGSIFRHPKDLSVLVQEPEGNIVQLKFPNDATVDDVRVAVKDLEESHSGSTDAKQEPSRDTRGEHDA